MVMILGVRILIINGVCFGGDAAIAEIDQLRLAFGDDARRAPASAG